MLSTEIDRIRIYLLNQIQLLEVQLECQDTQLHLIWQCMHAAHTFF